MISVDKRRNRKIITTILCRVVCYSCAYSCEHFVQVLVQNGMFAFLRVLFLRNDFI